MTPTLPLVIAAVVLCSCGGARPGAETALAAASPVQTGDWPRAAATAAASGDPLEVRLVAYLRALAPGAAPGAIARVLHDSPEFPNGAVLRARYGAALATDADDDEVRTLCAATRPAVPDGLARCADAERAAGDTAAAAADARAAWRGGAARDAAAEAGFLERAGPVLTADDRWARFTVLAASGPAATAAAGRAAGTLDPQHRALAEARLALAAPGDAPDAAAPLAVYDTVPAPLAGDPALVLAVARALRRAGTDDAALQFWRAHGFAIEAAHPGDAFSAERDRLARALLAGGDVADALAVADDAAASSPAARADALFLAGWIALRYGHAPAIAADRFGQLQAAATSLSTRARAAYWLARASAAAGDAAAAHRHAADAAAYPTTFYGQRAAVLAGGASLERRLAAEAEPPPPPAAALAFAGAEMPRAALLLTAWGERTRARAFLDLADAQGLGTAADPRHVLAARLALSLGLPEEAVTVARRAAREGVAMPRLGWPRPVELPPSSVPAALMLGLMRQESGFDAGAVSPSGALGLCQLLPGTAAELGRRENERVSPARLTGDPALNMRLGSAYLAALLRRTGGIVPAAIASYNAGPHRVGGWPPAPDAPLDDDRTIDWIEAIPVSETRNYVEHVLENEAVYAASPLPAPASAEAMLALAPHG